MASTHDRAWLDADGYLFIEGRSDDTIIRGGENIAPAAIEDALLSHPSVADVAVVGVADDQWGAGGRCRPLRRRRDRRGRAQATRAQATAPFTHSGPGGIPYPATAQLNRQVAASRNCPGRQ
jgi:acyl-CoA synthetase (AMP-forming)/AMP-acid ligase II